MNWCKTALFAVLLSLPAGAATVKGTITVNGVSVPATISGWPGSQGTWVKIVPPPPPPPPPPPGNGGLQLGGTAIFFDPLNTPSANGGRGGQLDSNIWGTSRAIGGGVNLGQGEYDQWNATAIQMCDGSAPTVLPPHDIVICNGQMREASNDNNSNSFDAGDVSMLAMYPRQPFDFTGRTGTISFDVSNDSTGSHSVWPELWMTDLPVPAPFSFQGGWQSLPANGFGIRFDSVAPPGSGGECPNTNNLSRWRFTVNSVVVVRNFVQSDFDDGTSYGPVGFTVTRFDCVISSSGPGDFNHIEVRVSQNQIDIWASDAGTSTLRHIASVTNANLSFTTGLIWIEDAHYNADKETTLNGSLPSGSQRQHTFSWRNVAFDGPFTHRDFGYDAPDNTAPGANGSQNLGQKSLPGAPTSWSIPGLPANPQAAKVVVLFNFYAGFGSANPTQLTVSVNGHAHSAPWPYPDQLTSWRTIAVEVPLTDLIAGTNVVQPGADVAEVFANVDIVLANVPGGVPVLPGSNNGYPGGGGTPPPPPTAACNLPAPAFCDTFDEGPTSTPGREGDLDSSKWSVAHLAPSDISGNAGAVANPVQTAPIPPCKASFSVTTVYPPHDTLICDPSGTRGSELLTAVAAQNYGVNSYMIRQPFDFAGRTGKIDFDVDDGGGYQLLGGYPEINITQDPVQAPTFQEFQNFEAGPVPANAIIVKFSQGGTCGAGASAVNTMVYSGYAPTILPASSTVGCVKISPGAMNHYEIQLSQTAINIYGTDNSADGGQTFPVPHIIYSAAINLPFSRAYVHIGARNHATSKYGFGPDAIFHWDNIGFDGPVIANTVSYEIPDNTTSTSYAGATVMNLGYQLQDGTVSGKAAGIYDPVNLIPSLQFKNVNTAGRTSALLSFNAFFDQFVVADTTWGWRYRFNGGTWRTRTLTALEVTAINSTLAVGGAGSAGNISMLVSVPFGDLVSGTNTFEIVPLNAPMSYPPVIANIDLTLSK